MLNPNSMDSVALIPARLGSTRMEKKPLRKLMGKPLISFVAEKVLNTGLFKKVVVATDSAEVQDLFDSSEVDCFLTSKDHQSGTDRIYEVLKNLDCDYCLNIQGDEPLIHKEDLKNLISGLEQGSEMVSLYEKLQASDIEDLNKVKVLLDRNKDAIYFSRFGIPFSRKKEAPEEKNINSEFIGKHVGVYGYSKKFLKEFCGYGFGYHEQGEMLEQLRALEMGCSIKMFFTKNNYYGIDTDQDLLKVEKILKES